MKYRLGIFRGLAIAGIVALGLASGISGNGTSGTAEAARPSVTVTSHTFDPGSVLETTTPQGSCDIQVQVDWQSNAYAHKNGHYRLFLWSIDETNTLGQVYVKRGTVDKGTATGVLSGDFANGEAGLKYHSRVVFFTSKGKDGLNIGRELERDDQYLTC